jgi:prephenate dehydrogenase
MSNETKTKITIVGLGLIGGSLGLALKAGLPDVEIVGHDRDAEVELTAQKRGAITRREHNLPRAVEGASIVIVATPITTMANVFKQIAPDLLNGALVTDTASTKAEVTRWAADLLPEHVNFVGGHPMAGKETQGIENAEATLFQGRGYCICPSLNASASAIQQVAGIAQLVGSEPLFMDAAEHDQYAAAVSHLPLIVSTALFTLLRSSPSWEDLGVMASSGFRDITRLASTDPDMSHGIWRTNREAVIHWVERMIGELSRFRDMLQDAQDEALLEAFVEARLEREHFLREPPRRLPLDTRPQLDGRRTLMEMMVGGMMADKLRKAAEMPELGGTAPPAEKSKGEPAPKKQRRSLAERIEEGVRRDLEKMEARPPEKDAGDEPPPDRPDGQTPRGA